MFDVSAIYGYITALKEQCVGDLDAYKERIKIAEIAFRSSLTQFVLEVEDEKRLILFIRDFDDLYETLKGTRPKTENEAEWLAYEAMKASEAAEYIKRVQVDLSKANGECSPVYIATSQHNEKAEDVRVISGTQGLADYLGCGKTKAFEIIKSGVLKGAGIQYQVGRCWKFNAKKLTEYINDNPIFLK